MQLMKTKLKHLKASSPANLMKKKLSTDVGHFRRFFSGSIIEKILLPGCLGIGLGFYALSADAINQPQPLSIDHHIEVVAYSKNNVVPVLGTTFINTQIIFGQDEHIVDVESGDASAWTIHVDSHLANILNIKPTVTNSQTNLSVITIDNQGKRRFYQFSLRSRENPAMQTVSSEADTLSSEGQKPVTKAGFTQPTTYVIEFRYPELEKERLLKKLDFQRAQKASILNASKNPKDYNWDYTFSGSTTIMPLHVFDDGHFTYLQLRPNQPVPAVFEVNNKAGKESLVNYRRVGDYLVIETIAPQFTLRDGQYHVASIFNQKAIARLTGQSL